MTGETLYISISLATLEVFGYKRVTHPLSKHCTQTDKPNKGKIKQSVYVLKGILTLNEKKWMCFCGALNSNQIKEDLQVENNDLRAISCLL